MIERLSQPLESYLPLRITLRSLQARRNGSEIAIAVSIENGTDCENRLFVVGVEQYCEQGWKRGELSEEQFDVLERASSLHGALLCGENLLSYGSCTKQTLTRKIMRHGFSREEAMAASERLCEMGLIDEAADMKHEVEKCLRKLWGAGRIRAHLWTKGFEREVLDTLPSLLEEVDFPSLCMRLIQKQYGIPTDSNERNRVTAALYRYGYASSEIREAYRRLQQEEG